MRLILSEDAQEDIHFWISQNDRKTFRKIFSLIEDIQRNGLLSGIGKPERLSYQKKAEYSRRISHDDRLVYYQDKNGDLVILSCHGHYGDK